MHLSGLSPARVWNHFSDLSAIPRCSKQEAEVLAHIQGRADEWGLKWSQDSVGNLVVLKPASPGRRGSPIVLQAHVDMVCEQERGQEHDFSCDPLELVIEQGWVRAEGTTLGADNGIGVALILAVLEDRTLAHGPIEALFTVDEEAEMTGAEHFDAALISGRTFLNLDGEGDGQFLVGSAGGLTSIGRVPLAFTHADAESGWSVQLRGLEGGHSGADIHLQKGNALSLAARFASTFLESQPAGAWQLSHLEGGDKDNAIPREALLRFAGPVGSALASSAAVLTPLYTEELGAEGRGLELIVARESAPEWVLTPASQKNLLDLLLTVPDGVQTMSKVVPGLVETSCNLGNVRLIEGQAVIVVSERSSVPSVLVALVERVEAAFRLAGGVAERTAAYPPWPAKTVSRLVTLAPDLWEKVNGQKAAVMTVHAGLECGFWAQLFPDADLISFGPQIVDAHTPRERVEITSVERTHRFLIALLEAL